VAPGQDGDPTAAGPAGPTAGPPDHARAETYLRLCVEAELRRVQALPHPDPPGRRELPAPLRDAARLVLPPGRRAASALLPLAGQAFQALQPLAENTGRVLRPLTDTAERTLPPLAGNAGRALQPLADTAAKTLQPLASQVIGAVLPAADQAAQQLRPLAWQAAYRLQMFRHSGRGRLTRWPGRVHQATAVLRGTKAGATPDRWTRSDMSAGEGVRRLGTVTHALVQAGAVDRHIADSILADLETALAARSRIDAHLLFLRDVRASRRHQPTPAPAGPYLAAPVGVVLPAPPDSGLAEVYLLTLVMAPDRAALTIVGRRSEQGLRSPYQAPWPLLFGADLPKATDDRGNSYHIQQDSGWDDGDGDWGGILDILPALPAGIGWLELTLSPDSPPIRVDLADARGETTATSGPVPVGSPAERLVDAAALDLLHAAVTDGAAVRHDLSGIADIVTGLEGAGALESARGAVGRIAALAGRLGMNIPSGLRTAAPPGGRLPAEWANVLQNRHRRDGPRGVAPAVAVLPELDGARFVLAGLRSDPAGAVLDLLGWGLQIGPHLLEESGARLWSWSARDDQGRWHVGDEGHFSGSDLHADMSVRLVPPLHPGATSLEVTLAGRSGQVTATVPLDWRGRQ